MGRQEDGRGSGHGRRVKSRVRPSTVIAVLSMLLGVLLLAYPIVSQSISAFSQSSIGAEYSGKQDGLPKTQKERILARAHDYNVRLRKGETPVSGIGDPVSLRDKDYMGQLALPRTAGSSKASNNTNAPTDATGDSASGPASSSADPLEPIATLSIPKISVDLPIRHGTSDAVLSAGAGHLYGTSLPVGGKGTNSVLAGHRGLPNALIFTRLDELRAGDTFFIHVYGKTLAYKVDRIWVIDPGDTSHFAIDRNADRVTLLTCTPYGVNTQRLVVRGERVPLSQAAVQKDKGFYPSTFDALIVFIIVLVVGLTVARLVMGRAAVPRRGLHVRGLVGTLVSGRKPVSRR